MGLRPLLLLAALATACSRGPEDPPPPVSSAGLAVAPPNARGVQVSEPSFVAEPYADPDSPLLPDPEELAPDQPMAPEPEEGDDGGVAL